MSLLRLLPSLRTPVTQRAYAAAFSSSSIARARPQEPIDIADWLQREDTNTNESTASSTTTSQPTAPVDDGPPEAPADSYPRGPATPSNPVRLAKSKQNPLAFDRKLYAVSVKASRNNTIVTFARPGGNQLVTLTGGKLGFKKSNRNGYEAGYQCAVGIIGAMETEMERTSDFEWELFLSGFGQGRDAMLTALTTAVGQNVKDRLKRVTDRTPLKIGGTRGQKTRRV